MPPVDYVPACAPLVDPLVSQPTPRTSTVEVPAQQPCPSPVFLDSVGRPWRSQARVAHRRASCVCSGVSCTEILPRRTKDKEGRDSTMLPCSLFDAPEEPGILIAIGKTKLLHVSI